MSKIRFLLLILLLNPSLLLAHSGGALMLVAGGFLAQLIISTGLASSMAPQNSKLIAGFTCFIICLVMPFILNFTIALFNNPELMIPFYILAGPIAGVFIGVKVAKLSHNKQVKGTQ
jgi:uncharacterized membrane protein